MGLGYSFNVRDAALQQVQDLMVQLPGVAEEVLMDVVQNDVAKRMIQEMIKFTPVSKGKKRRGTKHAKDDNPYIKEAWIKGIVVDVYERPKYGYLVYPEIGIGQSEQSFMWSSVDAIRPELDQMVIDALVKAINGG